MFQGMAKTSSTDIDRVKAACSEILLISLLESSDMHGYEMCKEIERRTDGYFSLKHSTVYPLLHKLEKRGLVKAKWDVDSKKPRKCYTLTPAGKTYYDELTSDWRELITNLALMIPEVTP